MNTHASAFLLGCFPRQCCGVVYCHVLKSLRLDVVLTSFQTSFHMQLSRSSRPDIVWVLPCWWPWTLQLAAQQIWKWRKKRPARGPGVPCAAQQTALCWACLLAVLNVQHIGACSCCPTSCSIVSKQGLLFTAGRRFDIVPDVVPHAAQPVLKTRHSLGPPMLVTLDIPACCPADLEVKEKETCLLACLLSWMCNILVPVVADPQVAALSPSRVCSSQLDVVLTSFQTSSTCSSAALKTRHNCWHGPGSSASAFFLVCCGSLSPCLSAHPAPVWGSCFIVGNQARVSRTYLGPMLAVCCPRSALCEPYIGPCRPHVGLTWPYLAPMLTLSWPMFSLSCPMLALVSPILPVCSPMLPLEMRPPIAVHSQHGLRGSSMKPVSGKGRCQI